MTKGRRRKSIDQLVEQFEDSVLEQKRQIHGGSVSKGNRAARRYMQAFDDLRTYYGDEGREALAHLLNHESEDVRGMAAGYLLRYCTDRAMPVLEDIARRSLGFIQIDAAFCLKHWEEGTWNLDPAPNQAHSPDANSS